MLRRLVRWLPFVAVLALAIAVGSPSTPSAEAGGSCAYTLSTTVSGEGGWIGVSPSNSFACPTGLYNGGAYVTVIATADPGYAWDSWTGTDDDNVASTYVTMHGNRSIKATFRSNCVSLTTAVSGGGGWIDVSPTSSGGCPQGQYSPGAFVTVVATANPGYAWDSWSGTDDDSTRSTYVTMNGDRSIKATFRGNCYTLTTTVSGEGGWIGVSPGNSSGCPQGQYTPGTPVTVVATANSGYVWDSWTGTDDNSTRSTFVTMNGDRTAKATFRPAGSDATNTPVPPTNTPIPTSTPAPTTTPLPTNTPPSTEAPTAGPTSTPRPDETAQPTSTPAPTDTPQPQPTGGPASGDVNCDGRTNSVDASLLLQYSAGLIDTLPCLNQADILDDDVVNALDAAIILQITARLL